MKSLIAGQIQREWVFLSNGEYVPDRLGGNLIYALCAASLWDDRIGLLTRTGSDLPEHHRNWIERNSIADGIQFCQNLTVECKFLSYEYSQGNNIGAASIDVFRQKSIMFPKELLGANLSKNHHGDAHGMVRRSFYESEIPEPFVYAPIVLIMGIPPIDQFTLTKVLTKFSQPYLISLPDMSTFNISDKYKIAQFLRGVNCVILRESDLFRIYFSKDFGLSNMLNTIASFGVETIVLLTTNGEYLVFEASSRTAIKVPSYNTRNVDPSGIDPAFAGGFTAGMRLSLEPRTAAVYGSISASVSRENKSAKDMLDAHSSLLEKRFDYVQDQITDVPF